MDVRRPDCRGVRVQTARSLEFLYVLPAVLLQSLRVRDLGSVDRRQAGIVVPGEVVRRVRRNRDPALRVNGRHRVDNRQVASHSVRDADGNQMVVRVCHFLACEDDWLILVARQSCHETSRDKLVVVGDGDHVEILPGGFVAQRRRRERSVAGCGVDVEITREDVVLARLSRWVIFEAAARRANGDAHRERDDGDRPTRPHGVHEAVNRRST